MPAFGVTPLAAIAAAIAMTVVALWPVWNAAPYRIDPSNVTWGAAAIDLRPRYLQGDVQVRTLHNPASLDPRAPRQCDFAFDGSGVRPSPAAVMLPLSPPDARLFVNGLGLDVATLGGRGGAAAAVPPDGLQRGPNRIQTIIPKGAPYEWPRAMYYGPEKTLRTAGRRIGWIVSDGARAVAGVAGLAAALGFLSAAAFRRWRPLLLPSCIALAMAAEALIASAPPQWLGDFTAMWLRHALASVAALMLARTVAPETTAMTRLVAGLAGILPAMAMVAATSQEIALHATHWTGTAAATAGAGVALASALASARPPWVRSLATLAALALLALAASRVDQFGADGFLAGTALYASSATLGAAALGAWLTVQLVKDSAQALRRQFGLAEVVREQGLQLAAQQRDLERAIAERAALEERERLAREIHDGVGGSLVALLAQARGGTLAPGELEHTLQQTLADLRMMIDAQDHAQTSLAAGFSTFQTRIAPAFAAAGIALNWDQDDLDGRALKDPASLLNVFRVLQEACANVIRHSGATETAVKIGWDGASNALTLEVADNGKGGAQTAGAAGHGLRNMAKRAAAIGADLAVGPNPEGPGWRVRLRAPGG